MPISLRCNMKSAEVIEAEKKVAEARAWLDAAEEKLCAAVILRDALQEEYDIAVQNMIILRRG